MNRSYWEIMADNLRAKGFSVGWAKQIHPWSELEEAWTADAHRDDGRKFIGQGETLTLAFLALEASIKEGSKPDSI